MSDFDSKIRNFGGSRDEEDAEFIRLMKIHPELYPVLRQILAPQEPQHEAQETPFGNV